MLRQLCAYADLADQKGGRWSRSNARSSFEAQRCHVLAQWVLVRNEVYADETANADETAQMPGKV